MRARSSSGWTSTPSASTGESRLATYTIKTSPPAIDVDDSVLNPRGN
jgi:hypothetical protein